MPVMRFIRERIWSILPETVSRKQQLQAAALWGPALWIMAAVIAWRRAPGGAFAVGTDTWVLGAFGALITGLLLFPATASGTYLAVLRFFSIIGFFISHILIAVVFYLVVTPMGLAMKLTGWDPMGLKAGPPKWIEKKSKADRRRYFRLS